MRLINTQTLDLKEFFESGMPPYAILSHTWEEDEISFEEMVQQHPSLNGKKGYRKIQDTCRLARVMNLDWVWVDTCCIDKKSSAELTEAINSMFRWYERAAICYAYLSDWKPCAWIGDHSNFAGCRWFTRGWTLQELIAPQHLHFYDGGWAPRGTKKLLSGLISSITGIHPSVLDESSRSGLLGKISVAVKMSWASKRNTTRIEDNAYCLLGIFNINMPMMYGEGANAFHRLQEEICRQTNDLTLFAWETPGAEEKANKKSWNKTLFAPSPAMFQFSFAQLGPDHDPSRAMTLRSRLFHSTVSEHTVTNKGLRVEASLLRFKDGKILGTNACSGEYYFELGSIDVSEAGSLWIEFTYSLGIILRKCKSGLFMRKYPRLKFVKAPQYNLSAPVSQHIAYLSAFEKRQDRFYILRNDSDALYSVHHSASSTQVLWFKCTNATTTIRKVVPETHWDVEGESFYYTPEHITAALLVYMTIEVNDGTGFAILGAFHEVRSRMHLVDFSRLNRKFMVWFNRERTTREVPSWEEFTYQIAGEGPMNERHTLNFLKDQTVYSIHATRVDSCVNLDVRGIPAEDVPELVENLIRQEEQHKARNQALGLLPN